MVENISWLIQRKYGAQLGLISRPLNMQSDWSPIQLHGFIIFILSLTFILRDAFDLHPKRQYFILC